MIYKQPFFNLQLDFAEIVSAVVGCSLSQGILTYTNLYIRFGLGREFNPEHPVWQDYLVGLQNGNDRYDWTYSFYLKQLQLREATPIEGTFGCFSFGLLRDGSLRLHFRNSDTGEHSSLSHRYVEQRRVELRMLFDHVRQMPTQPSRVRGVSWLYNLEAYRRLFPPRYLETARAVRGRFQFMPLWGQFLDRHGNLKQELTERFRACFLQQNNVGELDRCFPFSVIEVEGEVEEFYQFYD
ncbi:MAG: hypothetical protein KDD67_01820 [Ignavibacteriae bacterium]|nr:hypothetical protein [Ignavibacteriota bacterium]MCB9215444.1 hypothetical protein [Ignavibacteria bacterium]